MSEIEGNTDQAVIISNKDIAGMFGEVDSMIERCAIMGSPDGALAWVRELRTKRQIEGVVTAKLLWSIKDQWELYHGINEDFMSYAEINTGYSVQTIRKYVELWDVLQEKLLNSPQYSEDIKSSVLSKPMKSLLLLTRAAQDDEINWQEVADASSHYEIREIVGSNRTSAANRLVIYLMRDGTLSVQYQDERYPLGILRTDSPVEAVQKAVSRIINSAGIVEM